MPAGFVRRRCDRPEFPVRLTHEREADRVATTSPPGRDHTCDPDRTHPAGPDNQPMAARMAGSCDWLRMTAPGRPDPGERDHDTIVVRQQADRVTARPIDGTGTTRPRGAPEARSHHPAPSPAEPPIETCLGSSYLSETDLNRYQDSDGGPRGQYSSPDFSLNRFLAR
jgi:hypothetical protein